jgi:epoxyqueuosine reductase
MKSRISAHARELGFDLCRVTSAASPETGAAFSTWLDLRRYGNMSYLPRSAARRRDPQRVLPGAQSIICVAVNYNHRSETGGRDRPRSHRTRTTKGTRCPLCAIQ